jgi:hypothetical protein
LARGIFGGIWAAGLALVFGVLPVLPIGCASRQKSLLVRGGYGGVRKKGLLKLEGKEYIVKDGDVLVIRHG